MIGIRKICTILAVALAAMAATPASACVEAMQERHFENANLMISKGNDPEYVLKELTMHLNAAFPGCNDSPGVRAMAAYAFAQYAASAKDMMGAHQRAEKAWSHYSALKIIEDNREKAGQKTLELGHYMVIGDARRLIVNILLGTELQGAPKGSAFSDAILADCSEADIISIDVLDWTVENNAYSQTAHQVIDWAVDNCRSKFTKESETSGNPLIRKAIFYLILANSAQDAAQKKALLATVDSELGAYRNIHGKLNSNWTEQHQVALDKLKAN